MRSVKEAMGFSTSWQMRIGDTASTQHLLVSQEGDLIVEAWHELKDHDDVLNTLSFGSVGYVGMV